MKYKEEKLPDELFDLFATKLYRELTSAEQKLVNQYMDAEEYQQYAQSVMSFTTTDQDLPIQYASLPIAQRKAATLKNIWNYNIPLYQAAAACVLVTLASIFLLPNENDVQFSKTTQGVPTSSMTSKIIDEKAVSRHLQEIELVVNNNNALGKSLAEEKYPMNLVFEY